MKHIFIINPTSGKGKALKIADKIKEVCKKESLEYELIYTKGPKDATRIARKYFFSKNIIYSVGGDGTLNEVVNGLVGSKNMLGIIPAGSGNDFYKSIKDMSEPKFVIDLGKINKRYFINIVSIGIDAEVNNNANLLKGKINPNKVYNASLVYTFFKYKFPNISFSIDEKESYGKCTILTICNGRVYGGGFKIAPTASLTDGYFDVYYVEKIAKSKMLFLLNKLRKGTHETSNKVHKSNATRIKFSCDNELVCNVDGETICAKKFSIKMVPHAITIYNNKELLEKILS